MAHVWVSFRDRVVGWAEGTVAPDARAHRRRHRLCGGPASVAPRYHRRVTSYDPTTALIVVDVQNDFADPHGSLSVESGAAVVPVINAEIEAALAAGGAVFYTQDWHPESTPHFEKDGGLWPVHCLAHSWGAELHPDLRVVRRETTMVRDRRAVRLIAEGRQSVGAERATIDVIPHNGNYLVLVCRAPRAAWNELAADFAFVLRTAELDPQSVEPRLQGPLLQQQRKQGKQPRLRTVPAAKKPAARRPLPTVKIPG